MTAPTKASDTHPNRGAHNWLVYDIIDKHLSRCAKHIKGSVFDLGAGTAPYKTYFLSLANDYVAVDWSDSCHDTAADIVADLNKPLSIRDNVADTVISLSVIEHLHAPQVMLAEAHRILKPGGAMIMQVPWQWWVHEPPYDFFRYTPYGLKYLLEQAQFRDIEIEAQAGFFTTLILKLNYFSLRFIRGPVVVRRLLRIIFGVFWYIGQKAAPLLDKLDKKWDLETTGYFVTAKKA